jgi:Ca-activated chloride channel family protein
MHQTEVRSSGFDAPSRSHWTGPNGPGDYITIVQEGAPEGAYLSYAITAGAYETRYVAGKGSTLGSVPIGVN